MKKILFLSLTIIGILLPLKTISQTYEESRIFRSVFYMKGKPIKDALNSLTFQYNTDSKSFRLMDPVEGDVLMFYSYHGTLVFPDKTEAHIYESPFENSCVVIILLDNNIVIMLHDMDKQYVITWVSSENKKEINMTSLTEYLLAVLDKYYSIP